MDKNLKLAHIRRLASLALNLLNYSRAFSFRRAGGCPAGREHSRV